jgi:hypothetical protein
MSLATPTRSPAPRPRGSKPNTTPPAEGADRQRWPGCTAVIPALLEDADGAPSLSAARPPAAPATRRAPESFLQGFSIEVMPRTAEKVEDFRALLPAARASTSPISTARPSRTWSPPPPASPAKVPGDAAFPRPHHRRPRDAGRLDRPLPGRGGCHAGAAPGGGVRRAAGDFHSSMQLMETGLFDRAGSRACMSRATPRATATSTPTEATGVMEALRWKQAFAERTDARWPSRRSSASRPPGHRLGRTAKAEGIRPARSISASRALPSCRPSSSSPSPAVSAPR